MLFTVESGRDAEELDIVCDREGIDFLIGRLMKLRGRGRGHEHLMTPSWAGDELTERRQTEDGVLVNHVRVVLGSDSRG